jgi:lipopolysaccharide export system protein LptA
MKRWIVGFSFAATLSAGVAFQAMAQISPSGGPVDITADNVEIIQPEQVTIWRGRVEVLQDQNRLRANVLRIYYTNQTAQQRAQASGDAWGDIDRMEAEGDVYFVTPTQVARGDRALYQVASDTITMTGNVVVTQGENVVRGSTLVVEVKTGRTRMDAAAGGATSGRVRGVFYPERRANAPAQPTPAQKAAPAQQR